MRMRGGMSFIGLIYILVGIFVAAVRKDGREDIPAPNIGDQGTGVRQNVGPSLR
jgi:hypothetical protein